MNQWQIQICGSALSQAEPVALELIRDGNATATPGAADIAGPQSREAYRIVSTARRIELRAPSSTGLYYAFQTLRQLVQGSGAEALIPALEIEDYPTFAYRGFMMDFAHGAVLTEDEVKRQLAFLARWKANQYYFYSETNIDLAGYPLLHSPATWSQESIRRIIAYARQRHIDVVPCVELYGHLHDLFRREQYASLAGVPHGGEINPRDPNAIAITEDWMRQIAALFPSVWFHIGLDEPWELERADPTIAKPERFYLDQLRRLSALAVKLGKRPMFWADVAEGAFIFKKYPELYNELPHEAIAVPWFYSTLPDFTPLVKPFADNGTSQMIATGIANWEEVSTDFDGTFRNIDDFTAAGRKFGALGLINTGWTDSAQAIYREAMPAIAYGAIAAWQSAPIARHRFFADYAAIEYPLAPDDAAAAFASLAKAQRLLSNAIGSESMFRFWDDPLMAEALKRTAAHAKDLHECRLAVEDAQIHLAKLQEMYPDFSALSLAARMIDFAALKLSTQPKSRLALRSFRKNQPVKILIFISAVRPAPAITAALPI